MAGSSTWFWWLNGLVTAVLGPAVPAPGTHEARLEEMRVGALLTNEACKPAGQRDEELVHRLKVDYRQRQLANARVGVKDGRRTAGGARRACRPVASRLALPLRCAGLRIL